MTIRRESFPFEFNLPRDLAGCRRVDRYPNAAACGGCQMCRGLCVDIDTACPPSARGRQRDAQLVTISFHHLATATERVGGRIPSLFEYVDHSLRAMPRSAQKLRMIRLRPDSQDAALSGRKFLAKCVSDRLFKKPIGPKNQTRRTAYRRPARYGPGHVRSGLGFFRPS